MKPYGREKTIKGDTWKTDCHPRKGWVNWWEKITKCIPRSMLKQRLKKEIEKEKEDDE